MNESGYTKIIGGHDSKKKEIFMCRTEKNFYGNDEMIPGMLIWRTCYIARHNGEADSFGSYFHRFEVLVLKK